MKNKKSYFSPFRKSAQRLARDNRGLTTVEYVILLVIVAVGSISIWQAFRDVIETELKESNTSIQNMDK